jgi:hypothetical protein
MSQPIGRVSLHDLEAFLRQHAEQWDLEGLPSFDEFLPPHRPVDVDELILAISSANEGEAFAYLFSMEMTPEEALEGADLDAIPNIEASELNDYVIRMGKARDFLYVAPSKEDVSNGFYVNLMPVERQEDEEAGRSDSPPAPAGSPRITEISIENFKGIGPTQSLELRPITLLFGPNSGGKSTIIQAVHYALEVLDRRNLDAERTALGGSSIDLGGFERFVHKHDLRRDVRLGFGLDLRNAAWPDYSVLVPDHGRRTLLEDNPALPPEWASLSEGLPHFHHNISTAFVEVTISWSELDQTCHVESYRVSANGSPVATISRSPGGRDLAISDLNTKHPLFRPGFASGEYCYSENDSILDYWLRLSHGIDAWGGKPLYVAGQKDALPEWGRALTLQLNAMELWPAADKDEAYWADWAGIRVVSGLSEILVGTGEILRNLLRELVYLGPIRDTPTRGHKAPRYHEGARWARGLAAWDILYHAGPEFVEEVGDWLAERSRLDTGYRIVAQQYREIDTNDPLMGMLLSEVDFELEDIRGRLQSLPLRRRLLLIDEKAGIEAEAQDVGVGITQIVPVVVLALSEGKGLAAIEQPELHVHPRVQIGLGDLFIRAIHSPSPGPFLIETHSEHLLLRLLRRIRETNEGELSPDASLRLQPDQLAVYYVENSEGRSTLLPLRVDETGEFIDRWPQGFFEERAEELF